ncbi:MAG: helix-turn-helix domain-containing protein [Clostridia bacterium]
MEKPREWISVKEAAKMADAHTNTIYNWMKEGKIRHVKEGRSYKLKLEDVIYITYSKLRISEDKQILRSIQVTKHESSKVLDRKTSIVMKKITQLVKEVEKEQEECDKRLENIHVKYKKDLKENADKALEELKIKSNEERYNLRKKKKELLIGIKDEIQSFYSTCESINMLEEIYAKQSNRIRTLDEELKLLKE